MNFKDKLWEMYAVDLPYRDSLSLENGSDYRHSIDSKDLKDLDSKEEKSKEFNGLFESDEYAVLRGDQPAIEDNYRKRRKPKIELAKILTGTVPRKLEIIHEAIEEINTEIEKRMEMSRDFGNEVDQKIGNLELPDTISLNIPSRLKISF